MPKPDVSFLRGSMPPILTPFRGETIDRESFAGLLEHQVASGSHGVLVNGTTSEPASLTVAERKAQLELALEVVGGRVPVIAASGSQSLAETLELSRHAAEAGADALLIVTPYYSRPPQRGIVAYYRRVTEGLELPWMIYHIPGRAAVGVTLETVRELWETSETFVGMKHASTDLAFVSHCLAAFGEAFRVFVGLEELSFPMLAVGACGLMNAVGNLRPQALAALCEAVWRGDLRGARALHDALWELNQAVFWDINPIPMKYLAKRLGLIAENDHRLPLAPATADLERRLDALLARLEWEPLEVRP